MVPCGSFDAGEAGVNRMARQHHGPVAALAMKDAFVVRNLCDGPNGECHLTRVMLPELAPGSQVMLTTAGNYVVGIDHDDGRMWTFEFDQAGRYKTKTPIYAHETDGPAQLVIGLRSSNRLIVRDRQDRLAVYVPKSLKAIPIAEDLGDYVRLAAVGERHVAVRVIHDTRSQSVYLVDLGEEGTRLPIPVPEPSRPHRVATGDFKSIVFGPGDATLVLSEGDGADAAVLVFDVGSRNMVDAFAGEVISSHEQNSSRKLEELPGLHALSPSGSQLAYRTVSGSLAVRHLGTQSSCLVRNTNRLGTGDEPNAREGNHALAGFSAAGVIYAEYTVGTSQSFVYAYDPIRQENTPLGRETEGWHLAAVPGHMATQDGEPGPRWAVGVHDGKFQSIAQDGDQGDVIGHELTFMPRHDQGIWAIDSDDELIDNRTSKRALSVRHVAPPRWLQGQLRFEQSPDEQIVDHFVVTDDEGMVNQGPLRVPLSGRLCLATGTPGSWAYRCGDTNRSGIGLGTNSGAQEQTDNPNELPEFDPPFPDQGDGPGPGGGDDEPNRNE